MYIQKTQSMESAKLSQKHYLKKYLSGDDGKKKQKKKLKVGQRKVRIIDDDIDVSIIRPVGEGEFDILNATEDAPQIVGIIDERGPVDFSDKRRWKIIADDGDGNVAVCSSYNQRRDLDNADDFNCTNDNVSRQNASRYDSFEDLTPPRQSKRQLDNNHEGQEVRESNSDKRREISNYDSPGIGKSKSKNKTRRQNVADFVTSQEHQYKGRHIRRDSDSDYSPPRLSRKKFVAGRRTTPNTDTDLSPPRGSYKGKNRDPQKERNSDSDLSPPRPVVRKNFRRGNTEADAAERREQNKKQEEMDAKYAKWGKGLKQGDDYEEKLQQDLYEMSKPFARYADDADLDAQLRAAEREGDPMLEYIKEKQIAEGKRKPDQPKYQGSAMPNRFGINPGHRWDGVDRGNGYEKKWFEARNAKKAMQEEAYKWSTADM